MNFPLYLKPLSLSKLADVVLGKFDDFSTAYSESSVIGNCLTTPNKSTKKCKTLTEFYFPLAHIFYVFILFVNVVEESIHDINFPVILLDLFFTLMKLSVYTLLGPFFNLINKL